MRRFKGAFFLGTAVLLRVAITFSAAQAGVTHRMGPSELYDIDSIKNMTLSDLEYQETNRYTIRGKVLVIFGDWSNGEWDTFDREGNPRTIRLHQRSALYLPLGAPSTAEVGLIRAAHVSDRVRSNDSAIIALVLGMPVLAHGEYSVDWDTLGYANRNQLLAASLRNVVTLNPIYPSDFVTGNFFWVLPHTNMCAITLLQRLASQEGRPVERVGLEGGSKEGYACWVASAVDDRIETACLGGYQFEDFVYGFHCYETDWNWEDYGLLGPIMEDLRAFYRWLTETPAGEAAESYFSVSRFKEDLHPRVFCIYGDVTYPGMHDAPYYPLGAESPFLEAFNEKNCRYSRRSDGREPQWLRQRTLLYLTSRALSISDEEIDMLYPKVIGVEAYTTENREFRILAQATGEIDSVRLWWSHSETRRWNEEGQAPWISVAMERQPNGFYVSEWQQAPDEEEIAYYVEAETWYYVEPYRFPCRDASPVQFLWRIPAYTVRADLGDSTSVSDSQQPVVPVRCALYQNHPNPFNAETTISYQLPVGSYVTLQVYDLLGRRVVTLVDSRQQTRYGSVVWDASGLSSGLYFYRLTAGDYTETKRMMLVK